MSAAEIHACDFLLIRYRHSEFFINRSNFSGSVVYSKAAESGCRCRYLSDIIRYGEITLPAFDVDRYLQDHFKSVPENTSKLCIISRYRKGSAADLALQSVLPSDPLYLSADRLAFIITSDAEIGKFSVNTMHLLPARLRLHCRENGILSCSFEHHKIRYFIDLFTLLGSAVRRVSN
ncbi:MAG: hypothetical protein A2096_09250 [Spirochaetes bacterium GWF1_41_5]|nr:MAG: hypothetical protein A2096_09250 [Spirochaetes bacterium GWF1_41_5]HBE02170.1 hypothetical protein [Spirochaetia bacterium]